MDYSKHDIYELFPEQAGYSLDSRDNNNINTLNNIKTLKDIKELKCKIWKYIRHIKDFPKQGVILRDLTMCFANPECLNSIITLFLFQIPKDIDGILGIESKGLIFASILAEKLKKPLILVRKQNKLPRKVMSYSYSTEYSTDTIEIDIDSVKDLKRFIFVDDVLATGGTSLAVYNLLKNINSNAEIVKFLYVIILNYLKGIDNISDFDYYSIFNINFGE